ncbi:MAG: uridine kinase [Gemmatimonadota bacterium]|nr:MAG: uridine kinase [Gemmatimonadota bacterium]
MHESLPIVVQRIVALDSHGSTALVAIDGLGGAGKTTYAAALICALQAIGRRVEAVHFDDFYWPSSQRPAGRGSELPVGGHFDWRRLRDQVLTPLRSGQAATYDVYDWNRDELASTEEIAPGAIVVVEGVSCSRRELAALYDLRVWVECPYDLRLARGIERDGEGCRDQWELDWAPAEQRYIEEHRPHENADVYISGTK